MRRNRHSHRRRMPQALSMGVDVDRCDLFDIRQFDLGISVSDFDFSV
jgi:hypothetical protein